MEKTENKGKMTSHDQSDLLEVRPYASIGPDRSTDETKSVVSKLKKKKVDALRAKGTSSGDC